MEFTAENKFKENLINLARKIGYKFQFKNEEKKELSFVRILGKNGWPRFHIYLKAGNKSNKLIFGLHLDQKKPVYKGVSAHSADYEGEAVKAEAERVKNILKKLW